MRRLTGFLLVAALLSAALFGGFAVSRFDIGPANDFADRVERKLETLAGDGSETQRRLEFVESIFLSLAGQVYEMPQNDWVRGGGMTVWDDDLIVVARTGRVLRLIDGEGLVETSIATPPNGLSEYRDLAASEAYSDYRHKPDSIRYNDITYVDAGSLRGLALSYTFFDPDRVCYGSRVAWLSLADDMTSISEARADAGDWRVVFETSPCLDLDPDWAAIDGLMAGGRMAFLAPSTLYFGSGDYHLDGVHTYDAGIQSDDSDYGKMIAIDLATGEARHVSKGHRNTQGVAVDGAGRLWVTEHGVRGGDELNLIREGANYGWPLETLGTLYSGQPWPRGDVGRHVSTTPPVYAWLPSAAVSALAWIDDFHPAWNGDLLAGSLSGPENGQSLFRLRIEDQRVLFAERIRLESRVRYIQPYGTGRIAVWLDTNELAVFSVAPRRDYLAVAFEDAAASGMSADLAAELRVVFEGCGQCHAFSEGRHGAGPSLASVLGASVAGTGFSGYSDALSALGGRWTEDRLKSYLADPSRFAPGTAMPDPGLDEGPLLDGVVEILRRVSEFERGKLPYE